MGTCCDAHLTTKIRDYAPNAQNGAVTVTILENPKKKTSDLEKNGISGTILKVALTKTVITTQYCDYCKAPAEFSVSYYPKSNLDSDH